MTICKLTYIDHCDFWKGEISLTKYGVIREIVYDALDYADIPYDIVWKETEEFLVFYATRPELIHVSEYLKTCSRILDKEFGSK